MQRDGDDGRPQRHRRCNDVDRGGSELRLWPTAVDRPETGLHFDRVAAEPAPRAADRNDEVVRRRIVGRGRIPVSGSGNHDHVVRHRVPNCIEQRLGVERRGQTQVQYVSAVVGGVLDRFSEIGHRDAAVVAKDLHYHHRAAGGASSHAGAVVRGPDDRRRNRAVRRRVVGALVVVVVDSVAEVRRDVAAVVVEIIAVHVVDEPVVIVIDAVCGDLAAVHPDIREFRIVEIEPRVEHRDDNRRIALGDVPGSLCVQHRVVPDPCVCPSL